MTIQEKLATLPAKPGVYIMKNEQGKIIYVGKAISLKNRVRSYFQSAKNQLPKVKVMVSNIRDFEYIVTDSEVEALILECNLIKKHEPRYNVRLKDDKSYPYLKITINEEYPRVLITRRVIKDGAKYYGPYTVVGAVNETVKLLKKIFPLRTCNKKVLNYGHRACLNYHIKQCLAPCTGNVDKAEYAKMIKQVCLFLEGRQDELIKEIARKMQLAAEELQFEQAAELRNQMQALQKVVEKQKIVSAGGNDQDVIALARGINETCAMVFFVRRGKLIGREHYFLKGTDDMSRSEVMTAFVKQYYSQVSFVAKEILLQEPLAEHEVIEEWLGSKKGQKVNLQVPQKGAKHNLVAMVAKNAIMVMELQSSKLQREKDMTEGALLELKEYLGLDELPYRIECYDISNTQGTESVASMVVFEGGKPKNSEYRRFKIKTVEGPNDFASIQEVIGRRFSRAAQERKELTLAGVEIDKLKFAVLPDLVIIDGGKGQLSAARESMHRTGFSSIATYGLAKEEELLFKEGYSDPIVLPRNSQALYLIQRVRDEAHRFAITYHRKLRGQRNLKSILDDIAGIGEIRKKSLLTHFKTLDELRQATIAELAAAPDMNKAVAENVYNNLHQIIK